jgi:hypothetical protein
MTEQDRTMFIELIGSVQLQAAMFQGLLEILTARGVIAGIDENDLFNIAQMRLDRGPDQKTRTFAKRALNEWRQEGLLRGGRAKFS